MTKGPLTPPMVLYLIRGVTLNDDDSRGSVVMAASKAETRVECGDGDVLAGGGLVLELLHYQKCGVGELVGREGG